MVSKTCIVLSCLLIIFLQVLQDFDIKFGTETASRLLEQWDSLKPKVIAEEKTLTSNLLLSSLLAAAQANGQNQENCYLWKCYILSVTHNVLLVVDLPSLFMLAGWDSDMSSLLLLAFLLPPSAGGRKKSTKISIRVAMDCIVQFHKVCTETLVQCYFMLVVSKGFFPYHFSPAAV